MTDNIDRIHGDEPEIEAARAGKQRLKAEWEADHPPDEAGVDEHWGEPESTSAPAVAQLELAEAAMSGTGERDGKVTDCN